MMLTVERIPSLRSTSLRSPLVEAGEVAQVADDLLDPLQALAGTVDQPLQALERVVQVDPLGLAADPAEQLGLVLGQRFLGLLVEPEQVVQVADVAPEHGDVVADEGQRVVDLVRDPGHHLAQAGELLGLHELDLRLLELLVREPERLVRLAFGVGDRRRGPPPGASTARWTATARRRSAAAPLPNACGR